MVICDLPGIKDPFVDQRAFFYLNKVNRAVEPAFYFSDSEFYQMRGGFTAEVIRNPFVKFTEHILLTKAVNELTQVTMAAFDKSMNNVEVYAPQSVIIKNAIMVDWLTIIRQGNKIVAYATSSYLEEEQKNLYLSATIVDKDYQAKSGLGLFAQIYIWEKILKLRNDFESHSLNIVTRSRNKDVARILKSLLKQMKISGDDLNENECEFFKTVAHAINSPYNTETGINPNVYPAGLPVGLSKNDDIDNVFSKLGECDAFLLAGKIDYEKIVRLLKREITRKADNRYFENEITPTLVAA
jgi:hypothetical protein